MTSTRMLMLIADLLKNIKYLKILLSLMGVPQYLCVYTFFDNCIYSFRHKPME